ncbi:hypothetical protein C0J52_27058 [Blattella germanica]|nr:hypothetical protein C0J52_27058 [Blattella germanica]
MVSLFWENTAPDVQYREWFYNMVYVIGIQQPVSMGGGNMNRPIQVKPADSENRGVILILCLFYFKTYNEVQKKNKWTSYEDTEDIQRRNENLNRNHYYYNTAKKPLGELELAGSIRQSTQQVLLTFIVHILKLKTFFDLSSLNTQLVHDNLSAVRLNLSTVKLITSVNYHLFSLFVRQYRKLLMLRSLMPVAYVFHRKSQSNASTLFRDVPKSDESVVKYLSSELKGIFFPVPHKRRDMRSCEELGFTFLYKNVCIENIIALVQRHITLFPEEFLEFFFQFDNFHCSKETVSESLIILQERYPPRAQELVVLIYHLQKSYPFPNDGSI